ncbi:MAG: glycosidase, partial [Muribaculaceae bacterium]|nr:glycosidase [Muribaculaceae bacterium]
MKKLFFSILAAVMLVTSVRAEVRSDFRDETIYFLMTTRFYDGDPSNNAQCWDNQSANYDDPPWRGDFKGLIEKLDYIKALGFTAIWITPVVQNASGYDYHGYHAFDMSKVDPRYESDDTDLQTLIDAVHAKGMKIIIDIVLNHTGNFGEANLCKLFDRDWSADQGDIDACMIPFTQKDGGKLPDNYLSLPGGQQYSARLAEMKNTDGKNHDTRNLWHHFGNFNWDDDTRWWA